MTRIPFHESTRSPSEPPRRVSAFGVLDGLIDREVQQTTLGGIHIEQTEKSKGATFWDGSVRVVGGVNLSGLWHYSTKSISHFDDARAPKGGKFGRGTYLGAGELSGETVDGLMQTGAMKHSVSLRDANVLVVDRARIKEVSRKSKEATNTINGIRSSFTTDPELANRLASIDFGVGQVDGVVVMMDEGSSEVVLLPSAYEKVTISPVS